MTISTPVINPVFTPDNRAVNPVIAAFTGDPSAVAACIEALTCADGFILLRLGSPAPQARRITMSVFDNVRATLQTLTLRGVDSPSPDSPEYAAAFRDVVAALDVLAPQAHLRNAAVSAVGLARQCRDVYVSGFRNAREAATFRDLTGALVIHVSREAIISDSTADVIITGEDAWGSSKYMQGLSRTGRLAELRASSGAIAAPLKMLNQVRRQG